MLWVALVNDASVVEVRTMRFILDDGLVAMCNFTREDWKGLTPMSENARHLGSEKPVIFLSENAQQKAQDQKKTRTNLQ